MRLSTVIFTLALLGAMPAHAVLVTVTTENDVVDAGDCAVIVAASLPGGDGVVSLREAVCATNNMAGPDEIRFTNLAGSPDTYTMAIPPAGSDSIAANGDYDIRSDLTIRGNGSEETIIDGAHLDRLFDVATPGTEVARFFDLTIQNGDSTGLGGGVWNSSDILEMTDCVVKQNDAVSGGGVASSSGTNTFTRVSVYHNTATSSGGGIDDSSGTWMIIDTMITGNMAIGASSNGGGIDTSSGDFTLSGVTIHDNSAGNRGGAMNSSSADVIVRDDSVISENRADEGGAINTSSGEWTFTDVTFRENHALDGDGGVFHPTGSPDATFTRVDLVGNTATGIAGAIQARGGTNDVWRFENCEFHGNIAGSSGGAIFNDKSGTLDVVSSLFGENEGTFGGALYHNSQGTLNISHSVICGNHAFAGAGVNSNTNGTLTIMDTTICENHATAENGGGGVHNNSNGMVTIGRSAIWGNTAVDGAGVNNNSDGVIDIHNTTISGNSTPEQADEEGVGSISEPISGAGAAIYNNSSGEVNVLNSTIAENTTALVQPPDSGGANAVIQALPAMGAIQLNSGGPVNLKNTIVAYNIPQDCAGNPVSSQGHNIDTDGTCNLTDGGDLPSTDPLIGPLDDNGGTSLTHLLLTDSPAIDMADDTVCPDDDQRKLPRPRDGDFDGVVGCDRGALELQPKSSFISVSSNEFALGVYLFQQSVYAVNPEAPTISLFTTPGPASLRLDAVDVRADGKVWFSTKSNGFSGWFGPYIQQNRPYLYDPQTGAITPGMNLGVSTLDALDVLADDSVVFSTASNQWVSHAGGWTYVRQQNAYRKTASGHVTQFFNGNARGLGTLIGFDAFPDGRMGFTTKSNQFVGFTTYVMQNSAYVWDPGDGGISQALNGNELQFNTLDAVTLGDGIE